MFGHRVGCLDAASSANMETLVGKTRPTLAIHDPPYNFIAFDLRTTEAFIDWSRKWIQITYDLLSDNASMYIWLGADQKQHYEPLPQFMLMMGETKFQSRSFITMRNQRGYGTQKNWMAIRQELLYYIKGNPQFYVDAEYTDVPKVLKGYYKEVAGKITENSERSKSEYIRAGNVWIDIQQVFYRMHENVNGCFAQKPIKAIDRIVRASSAPGDVVIDFFAHSGATLLACELLKRRCLTVDIDPIYCEITIRRLENFRQTGNLGWQNSNPFSQDLTMEMTNGAKQGKEIYEDLFGFP